MTDKSSIDHVIRKYYDVHKKIGTGAYGSVWECIERASGRRVAVKKIEEAFRNSTDAQRTYREVTILRQLRRHPNVVRLYEVRRAANNMDMYLVFEHMDIDLHQLISKKGNYLCDQHYQLITQQILSAVKYMHSAGIVHRDLKPSNILVSSRCQVKVGDLGLARTLGPRATIWTPATGDHVMTGYVATRWYRPPEILLGCKRYTRAVDLWSVGCILAEMVLRKPLFQGENSAHQIDLILAALPQPTIRDLESLRELGAEPDRITGSKKGGRGVGPTLAGAGACAIACHLADWLLALAPACRPTAARALGHPFLAQASRAAQHPPPPPLPLTLALRDDTRLTVEDYRTVLYRDADAKSSPRLPFSPVRKGSGDKVRNSALPSLGGTRQIRDGLSVPPRMSSGGDSLVRPPPLPVARPPQARARRYGRAVTTTAPRPIASKSEPQLLVQQHSVAVPMHQTFPSIRHSYSLPNNKCLVTKVYRRGYTTAEVTRNRWQATVQQKGTAGMGAT